MKIGKWITILLLSNILITSFILGQSGETASANISITIVKPLQIDQIKGDLSFGEFVLGSVSTKLAKTPNDGILFEVSGHEGRNVVIDYQNAILNNQNISENSTIQFRPEINTTFNSQNYSNATSVAKGSSYQLANNNGDGILYLWVGGEMDIDSKLPSGNYSGEFAVTVSY
jgi:hypothetical protein